MKASKLGSCLLAFYFWMKKKKITEIKRWGQELELRKKDDAQTSTGFIRSLSLYL